MGEVPAPVREHIATLEAVLHCHNPPLALRTIEVASVVQFKKSKSCQKLSITLPNYVLLRPDGKNREITKELVQPVPPSFWWFWGEPKMALLVPESKF